MTTTFLTPADREWHERRLDGFGGSEVAALLGISPWANARTTVERKARRIIQDPDAPERLRLRLGREMEPILLEHLWEALVERFGTMPRPRRSGQLHRMPGHAFITADVDGFIGDALAECKTDEYGSLPWGDPEGDPARVVPPAYYAQVQHSVAAASKARAFVIVLIGLHEERVYEVPRSGEYIADLLEFEAGMWARVVQARDRLADDPDASIEDLLPPLEGEELTEHLRQRFPRSSEVIRSADADQDGLIRDLREEWRAFHDARRRWEVARGRVQEAIGDAAGIAGSEGQITWRTGSGYDRVAWESVATSYRLLLEEARGVLGDRAPEDLRVTEDGDPLDTIRGIYTTRVAGSRTFLVPRAWDR